MRHRASEPTVVAVLGGSSAAIVGAAAALVPAQVSVMLLAVLVAATVTIAGVIAGGNSVGIAAAILGARSRALSGLAFILVAAAVVLVTFSGLRPLPGANAADVFFVLALVPVVVGLLQSPWTGRQVAPNWLIIPAALLAVAALLVALFPAEPSRAALLFQGEVLSASYRGVAPDRVDLSNGGAAIRFVGTLLLVPLLIAWVANSAHRIRLLADIWITGVAVGGLMGTLGYLGIESIAQLVGIGNPAGGTTRVAGFAHQPNAFALASAMALPVAATGLARTRGRARLYYSAVVLALIAGIAISGSRAGLIGGFFGIALLAILHPEGRRGLARVIVPVTVLVVAWIALSPTLPPAVERLLGSTSEEVAPATEARTTIYPAILGEVVERPIIGHGFQYIRGSHNIYLQLLHSGGIVALTGFLLFAVGSTVSGLRLARDDTVPADLRSLSRALVASMAVWLGVVGLVAPAIFDRFLYVPAGLTLAIWVVARHGKAVGSTSAGRAKPLLTKLEGSRVWGVRPTTADSPAE